MDDAVRDIVKRYEKDPKRCADELIQLWIENKGKEHWSIEAACKLVGPEDALPLLKRIDALLTQSEPTNDELVRTFFTQGAPPLSGKILDPEPLVKCAVRHGCWEVIANPQFICPPALRERYILEGVARCQRFRCLPPQLSLSIIPFITDTSIDRLHRIFDDLRSTPSWAGFKVVACALAEFDDRSIVDGLESVISSKKDISASDRLLFQLLAIRLKTQDDPEGILGIIEHEVDNDRVLYWAIHRALRLKIPPALVESNLAKNTSFGARIFERRLKAAINGQDYVGSSTDFEPLSMSGAELREYRKRQRTIVTTWPAEGYRTSTLSALVAEAQSKD